MVYDIYGIDIHTKGDLKGYVTGLITFYYDGKTSDHEFLYRIYADENGPSDELVSIDYGYKVPYIDEVWEDIEEELKRLVGV